MREAFGTTSLVTDYVNPEVELSPVAESLLRVTKFLEEYAKMRNMDPETLHELNVGDDERSAKLTVSDLKNILTYIQ